MRPCTPRSRRQGWHSYPRTDSTHPPNRKTGWCPNHVSPASCPPEWRARNPCRSNARRRSAMEPARRNRHRPRRNRHHRPRRTRLAPDIPRPTPLRSGQPSASCACSSSHLTYVSVLSVGSAPRCAPSRFTRIRKMRATIHGRPHPSLSLEEERTGGPSAGTPFPASPCQP